ncbi:protein Spindly isoform X2 [Genypterus blacodes]
MCGSATEEEIKWLRQRLKETEEQLHQAAQSGLDCLNQQVELQSRLDEYRTETTNEIDALKQNKYSLQREVELKAQMLESLQSEYNLVINQQTLQLQQQKDHLDRSHSTALSKLNNKTLWLQSLLEESQLSEKQLKQTLQVQTESLNNKAEELRGLKEQTQSVDSRELKELQVEITALENTKVEFQRLLQESQNREQQLELSNRGLQRHLEQIQEERESQAVSWFNALEKSREMNQDLQVQLDQVQQQAQDPNSKGNSLFAELEDKRAEMERQLISVRVQHQSLQKHHSFTKQQLQRMKVQIATLMQLQGSRADPAQLERLQFMLSEKNSEIQNLMTKLGTLEKEERVMMTQPSGPAPAVGGDGRDETFYTDLLKMKLNKAIKDAERLGEELSLQRMKALSESQRALELERKLFTSERLHKQAQSDKIKVQLRVEELQQKYEPKDAKKNLIQKGKREKLPVEEAAVTKTEAVVTVEIEDTKQTESSEPDVHHKGETLNSTDGSQPVKRVKISPDLPVIIYKPSSPPSECKVERSQGRNRREEDRKTPAVEVIHVGSTRTMENECAQQ